MTTPNLAEFANLILKLTWSEMEEIGASDAFGSSYSRTKPANLVEWAKKQVGVAQDGSKPESADYNGGGRDKDKEANLENVILSKAKGAA